jgi:hypothetical protein
MGENIPEAPPMAGLFCFARGREGKEFKEMDFTQRRWVCVGAIISAAVVTKAIRAIASRSMDPGPFITGSTWPHTTAIETGFQVRVRRL